MSSNQSQALGSRLKELRLERDFKISEMAENLGISSVYVGLLEKGTKKASIKVLEKYADFFKISVKKLENLKTDNLDNKIVQVKDFQSTSEKIRELNVLLSKLNDEIQESLLEQFKEQVQQTLYNFQTLYDVSDIKQYIMKLINPWFLGDEEIEHDVQTGYITLPSGPLYFQLETDRGIVQLQLKYEDREHLYFASKN